MTENMKTEDRNWHIKSIPEIFSETKTNRQGLTEEETKKRLQENGPNTIAKEEKNSALKMLLRNFNSLLIYVLLTASLISLFSDHVEEFIVIMVIILFTGLLGFIQEYRAGKSVEALSKLTAKKVDVLRNNKRKEILAENLVQGDIVFLKRGMIVPADIRIIESNGLRVDESILTGESVSKAKYPERLDVPGVVISDRTNMIFNGTNISGGSGLGVVVETGIKTELGKISMTLRKIGYVKSPLQKKLDGMSKRISLTVIGICVLFFFILLSQGLELLEALLFTSVLAVSGIPESFPLALTLGLSNGVKKMAKQKAIVKDLGSVETLGTTTVICTDKTGTLTENKMRVVKAYLSSGEEIDVTGKGYEPISMFSTKDKQLKKEYLQQHKEFLKTCVLCNNAELTFDEGEWILSGEPTEGALLTLAKSAGIDDALMKEDNPKLYEVAFDSRQKYMITINKSKHKGTQTAYLKGAYDKIIEKCDYIRIQGKIKKLTPKDKARLSAKLTRYASLTLRVLALATKKIPKPIKLDKRGEITKAELKHLEKGYVLEGLLGIEDPIKEDVYKAVEECVSAGIKVIIVTGDHKHTATSIGKKLGLVKSKYDLIIEGSELDNMDDEDLDNAMSKVVIFARATPEHKFRIVNSLQRLGEIVAMTGDGVNDAPALKKADIGVSMGKTGTDVAREASNMVLADDSFSTIVKAVKQGRTIYSNIRRFIYYLLTGNFTEVTLIFISVLIGILNPLTAIMVLFVNIVTSTFPASALSIEPTRDKVMQQKPRNPKEKLLSGYVLLKILVLVPILFVGTLLLFIWELEVAGATIEKARTVAFVTLIMFELFHTFNARSLHTTIFNNNFFKNKYIFIAVGLSFLCTLLAVYWAPAQGILGTEALLLKDWLIIIIVSMSVIAVSEVIKLMIKSEFEEQNRLRGKGGSIYKIE
ncbi:HAD-IC family P-type ATPase [Candidatus Woesearchaeota archaeon]|nr:HAD-IC family P-type ATPase [Candidatus Woesearchaeota archaeon]